MKNILSRTDTATTKATISIFREEMRRDKRRVIAFLTLIPLGHLLYTVLLPLFLSLIIQSLIIEPHNLTTPLWLIGGMLAASIATVATNRHGFRSLFNHEEYVTTRLTKRAMKAIMSHSHRFFSDTKVGSLAGDVNSFARSYLGVLDTLFLQTSAIIVNYVASLIIICFLSPILFLPMAILTTLIAIQSIRSFTRRGVYRNERKTLLSQLNGTIADILGNQLLVRIFARAPEEISTVVRDRTRIESIAAKEIEIINSESAIRQITLFAFQIGFIGIAIWLFTSDMLSIAALVFSVTYLGRITSSLFNITAIIRSIEQAFLDAAPVTRILTSPIEVQDLPAATELTAPKGSVVFENVEFSYKENSHESVFKHLSLTIPAGQRIGLAGHSGGGKTTLTHLLLRFADTKSGRIMIDGQDIAHVTQDSLRAAIAYVPQDPFLFHRSLRENIAYSRPDATDEQIIAAARQAHATEFIDKLPDGLDTIVGERGVKLSGGQRQRIAIARAILKDAPILLLDEATSALDSQSEKYIQDALSQLMRNRTSIVIAHRLSTISQLDRIIVLDNGRIIEDGTHTALLARGGTYATLWAHQSGGFIEE